mgnify:CR=1 FL=1
MVKVKVLYGGWLIEITRTNLEEIEIDKDNATLKDLLCILMKRYGYAFKFRVYNCDENMLSQEITVIHNGISITADNLHNITLKNDDFIAIVPPLAGGGLLNNT